MSTVGNWRGPNIVKDGLVLNLDAGSPNSFYPSTAGTTWKDISGNKYNGTLTNGPTFSTANGGSIVLDGTNDSVDLGDNDVFTDPDGFTIEVWFKPATYAKASPFLEKYQTTGYEVVFGTFHNNTLYCWVYDNSTNGYRGRTLGSMSSIIPINTWGHFVYTYDGQGQFTSNKIFINGTERTTSNYSGGSFTTIRNTSTTLNVGRSTPGLGGPTTGSFGGLKLYNRALTAAEILQNYDATKTRFGL